MDTKEIALKTVNGWIWAEGYKQVYQAPGSGTRRAFASVYYNDCCAPSPEEIADQISFFDPVWHQAKPDDAGIVGYFGGLGTAFFMIGLERLLVAGGEDDVALVLGALENHPLDGYLPGASRSSKAHYPSCWASVHFPDDMFGPEYLGNVVGISRYGIGGWLLGKVGLGRLVKERTGFYEPMPVDEREPMRWYVTQLDQDTMMAAQVDRVELVGRSGTVMRTLTFMQADPLVHGGHFFGIDLYATEGIKVPPWVRRFVR